MSTPKTHVLKRVGIVVPDGSATLHRLKNGGREFEGTFITPPEVGKSFRFFYGDDNSLATSEVVSVDPEDHGVFGFVTRNSIYVIVPCEEEEP